jgi:hypothetical protein
MAQHRPNVPASTKRALVEQAGGKCANPGCPSRRTHLHHIQDWAVYQAHDQEHLIAICPTCHDAVHHGRLRIEDDTLYRWKQIERPAAPSRDQVYVEPGPTAKLLLGSICATGDAGLIVFNLSSRNRLGFALEDGDIFLLDLSLTDQSGAEVLRVTSNDLRHEEADLLQYDRYPGRHRVTAPRSGRFLPYWVLPRIREVEDDYAGDGRLTLIDLEVLKPGLVRIQGLWAEQDRAVIITHRYLHFVTPSLVRPISLLGHGEDTILHYTGPIDTALFGFEGDSGLAPESSLRFRR